MWARKRFSHLIIFISTKSKNLVGKKKKTAVSRPQNMKDIALYTLLDSFKDHLGHT